MILTEGRLCVDPKEAPAKAFDHFLPLRIALLNFTEPMNAAINFDGQSQFPDREIYEEPPDGMLPAHGPSFISQQAERLPGSLLRTVGSLTQSSRTRCYGGVHPLALGERCGNINRWAQ
nr:hypothetical protein [Parvularcula mediterranea]